MGVILVRLPLRMCLYMYLGRGDVKGDGEIVMVVVEVGCCIRLKR